jgi:hypothetical protein
MIGAPDGDIGQTEGFGPEYDASRAGATRVRDAPARALPPARLLE